MDLFYLRAWSFFISVRTMVDAAVRSMGGYGQESSAYSRILPAHGGRDNRCCAVYAFVDVLPGSVQVVSESIKSLRG